MTTPPHHLSDTEKVFWQLEFNEKRLLLYPERLKELGFCLKSHVLDLGCGMGQWSYALASLNNRVTAIDKNLSRISVATNLFMNECSNLIFVKGTCENIPSVDAQFDAVLIYGVLMFSDWRSTLREVSRVAKSGCIIYVNYNHIGRYIYRLFRPTGSYFLALRDILIMLISTLLCRKSNVLINDSDFRNECNTNSLFVVDGPKPEGLISTTQTILDTPFSYYPSKFLGMRCVSEFILVKR
jgi:2-polyprenyl-3-methyl-5-hydroxy-6-metoxy-1,4-benzoquinol methylase